MKNLFSFFALVLVASSFTLSTSANIQPTAAADFYLKIDGIPGESKSADHRGWIELESCSINAAGKTVNIAFMKTSNDSSQFAEAAASGRKFRKATLHVRKSGSDGTYLKYELENVLISNYSVSGASGGSLPMESLSINFTKITY